MNWEMDIDLWGDLRDSNDESDYMPTIPIKRRAVRRDKTARVIKRRLDILNYEWGWQPKRLIAEPHRLHKFNLSCGCSMCKFSRRQNYYCVSTKETSESQDMDWQETLPQYEEALRYYSSIAEWFIEKKREDAHYWDDVSFWDHLDLSPSFEEQYYREVESENWEWALSLMEKAA